MLENKLNINYITTNAIKTIKKFHFSPSDCQGSKSSIDVGKHFSRAYLGIASCGVQYGNIYYNYKCTCV